MQFAFGYWAPGCCTWLVSADAIVSSPSARKTDMSALLPPHPEPHSADFDAPLPEFDL